MRNVNVNSIGEYIREQREQAKISMRQLAQSAGEFRNQGLGYVDFRHCELDGHRGRPDLATVQHG